MPQLDLAFYIPQIFWLVVVFAALYFFMSRSVAPNISEVLKKRQDVIADDLANAEALQVKAEQERVIYEKSQADARSNAAALVLAKREELKAEAEAEYQKLSQTLGAEADEAGKRIDATKQKALSTVRGGANDVCAEIVAKISGLKLDGDTVSKVVDQKTDDAIKGDA